LQEEVENRTINLVITTAKLTGRMLVSTVRKVNAMENQLKVKEKSENDKKTVSSGKMSVKDLVKQNQGVTDVEISTTGIRDFERIARKYGIDFAVKKSMTQPPKYLVFFKSRDADALNAAVEEYAALKTSKDGRTSVIEQLNKLKEKVKAMPRKIKEKTQVR